MSGYCNSYGEGSSRSTRDDSRPRRDSRDRREGRRKSRSRSPRRRYSPPAKSNRRSPDRYSSSRHERDRPNSPDKKLKYTDRKSEYNEWSDEEEVPAPPPPPRITKISIGFSKPTAPIKMNLTTAPKPAPVAKPKTTVASVFNEDDDDEPEEMPAEARMRMRNIGRDTPTSAGPNSFGKTKQGFCDAKKVFERNLKQALETERPMGKFPQTIYKIKP